MHYKHIIILERDQSQEKSSHSISEWGIFLTKYFVTTHNAPGESCVDRQQMTQMLISDHDHIKPEQRRKWTAAIL